jgi:RND family efflux transporter, MFP subunit
VGLRGKYILPLIAAAVVCMGIGAFVVKRVKADGPATGSFNRAVPRAAIALVKRATVANDLSIAGEFLPYQEVEIHAKVAGYIRKINVDIGDRVRAGEVLAVLEVPELAAQVQGADASIRHSQDEITRGQDEVARAEADHQALHSAALRLKQASDARPGLVAEQELDDAQAKDRAAEAQVEAAKSALSAAKQQLDVSKANHLQVSAISDYSRITAPFAGVVTWRYADTGALVQAGTSNSNAQPVVKLAQIDVLRLRIPVPETLSAEVRLGDTADVNVQATGEHFAGQVSRSTGALDPSTRTMQVEVDVPNQKLHLAPGMYADVVLKVQKHANALTIPVQALQRNGDKSSVLVVGDDNRVQAREVHTGIEDPNFIEVLAGLKEGERIIVGNMGSYQSGEVVDPKLSSFAQSNESGGEQ